MKRYYKTTALAGLVLSAGIAFAISGGTSKYLRSETQEQSISTRVTELKNTGSTLAKRSRTAADGRALNSPALKTRAKEAAEGVVELYGTLLYSTDLLSGIYKIPTKEGEDFVQKMSAYPAKSGAVLINRTYYYPVEFTDGPTQMYAIDVDTWTQTGITEVTDECLASAAVYDPTTGNVYGAYYYDQATEICFGIGHYPDGHVTRIADLNKKQFAALAVDKTGQLFAIDYQGILYRVDKATGELTTVGNTGVVSQYNTSGAIDPATGIFYFAKSDDTGGYLYTIDTTNGTATLVDTFATEEEIGGMFVKPAGFASGVPASPENLSVSFVNGSTEGTVTFTIPEKTYGGATASDNVTYTLKANGKELRTAEAAYGEQVTVPVSLQGGTFYTFAVYAENRTGVGPQARLTQYIGKDAPAVPNVKASLTTAEDGAKAPIYVRWDPIEQGSAGGYINPAAVTYTVTRVSDGQKIAENITDTYFYDSTYGNESKIQYSVVASCEGMVSEPGYSNIIDMTVMYPPYLETFETKADFTDNWTCFNSGDTNGSDNKWTYYSSGQSVRAYYDFDIPKDDYLVSPGIWLEEGSQYKVTFDTWTGNAKYYEDLEFCIGTGDPATAKGGKTLWVDHWADKDPRTIEIMYTAKETGKHYLVFHAFSQEDCHYIYLDNISVSAPTGENVPELCTNIVVTPGENCAKTATVAFNAPTKSIKGQNLASLEKIEVYRASTLVKTFDEPTPGEELSFIDEVPTSGTHTYTIYAYNEDGMGSAAKASAYIGVPAPGVPTDAVMVENATPGNVTLTWNAPETFADGSKLIPEFVTYQIKNGKNLIASTSETSHTFQALNSTSQDFVSYEVIAVTEGGSSESAESNVLLVGSPKKAPYAESFKNASASSPLAFESVSGTAVWKIYKDDSLGGIASQDNDNGFIGLGIATQGASSALLTGRYDLSDIKNTALTFYTFPVGEIELNENQITVSVNDGTGWKDSKTIVMSSLFAQQAWNKVTVPLAEYDGKTIQLKLTLKNNSYVYTFIDNMRLEGINTHELVPSAIVTPYIVDPLEGFDVNVYVSNEGITTTGNYSVSLYRNDELIGTQEGENLGSGDIAVFSYPQLLDITSDRVNNYRAVVDYTNNPSDINNESDNFVTTLRLAYTPVVTTLTAEEGDNGVTNLSWETPDLTEAIPAQVTEDFESYDAWTTGNSLGEWTLVDRDGGIIGGPTNVEFPGIPGIGQGKLSYFIIDSSWDQISGEEYASHSGNKHLSNMYNYDWSQNDDWIISPELYGGHQLVTIYVKSFQEYYPEAVEILYSTTDKNPESFIHAVSMDPVPGEWTALQAALPDGAKYFAVRAMAIDAFMMFLDDFSYVPAGLPENLSIEGYHVYRDGQKITDSPVVANAYTDNHQATDETSYYVTVVYSEKGESAASNIAYVTLSGVKSVAGSKLTVRTIGKDIVITGADKHVTIVNAAGQVLYDAAAGQVNSLTVAAPGVYIVRDARNTAKVVVK